MDYHNAIFYVALLLAAGGVAELYVRMNKMGENVQKIRGIVVTRKPRLGPPIALVVAAIIVAATTIPH
jgi:hypothetical protein